MGKIKTIYVTDRAQEVFNNLEDIKMEEGDDLIFQQYLENNKMGNVRDVNANSETSAGLTKDEQQDLDNNVDETKDELNKKNCQTKGGS